MTANPDDTKRVLRQFDEIKKIRKILEKVDYNKNPHLEEKDIEDLINRLSSLNTRKR
jgi:hypothetical protein